MLNSIEGVTVEEHDQTYGVKKISPFISDGSGNLVRMRGDASGNLYVITGISIYSTLIDDTGTIMYVGAATPGTATSAASWSIFKFDYTSSPNSKKWADSGNYTQVWDNRASLTYS